MIIRKPEPALAPPHIVLLAVVLVLLTPRTAIAQVPWESPQLNAPAAARGVSLLYVDFGLRPFAGTGVMLLYRPEDSPRGIGLRVASTLSGSDRTRVSGGVDVARPLFRRTAAFPLDVQLFSGIGGGYGDYWTVALPVGASAGRAFIGSAVGLAPWTGARGVVEVAFGEAAPDDAVEFGVAAEVGADVWLRSAESVRLRAALSLGDRRALAIGVHIGGGARPAVAAQQRPQNRLRE